MIAPNPHAETACETDTAHAARWRLIGNFDDLETAEATARNLRQSGVNSTVSMINGLCVIARG